MAGEEPTYPAQSSALAARYGEDAVPAAGPWNDTIALLLSHRSIRGYSSKPVPASTLEKLVAAAQSAATSSNLQTWSVVAVTDPAVKAELSEIALDQRNICECPLFLVWIADLSRNNRLAAEEGTTLEGNDYLEMLLMGVADASLAAQNATVAAESLGLSTCYIGNLRNDVARVAELLQLPPGAMGVFGMCVGYPKAGVANEVKPRLPQELVLHHERYTIGNERDVRAAYDARVGAFSRKNDMKLQTWTDRVLLRLEKVAALRDRANLNAVLRKLGFPLK
jgi:nitroreductase